MQNPLMEEKFLASIRSGTNPFINFILEDESVDNKSTTENLYENLRNFNTNPENRDEECQSHQLKDYYNPENIYENICHDCGRIYDDICTFCNDDEPCQGALSSYKNEKNIHFIKRLFKKHFRSPSLKRSNSKIRKSDIFIVRNDGDTVFKTNCTFDLNEMTRMRNDLLLMNSGTNDDSHIQNNDKEDNGSKGDVIYENLPFHVDTSVSSWIELISKSSEDYEDEVYYNVKAIPSRTFMESEWNWNKKIVNDQKLETKSNSEQIERFMDLYGESGSIFKCKDLSISGKKSDFIKISWYHDGRHYRDPVQNSHVLVDNPENVNNNNNKDQQTSTLTPLNHNLRDNKFNLNSTTTIIQQERFGRRHQDKDTTLSTISKVSDIDNNISVTRSTNVLRLQRTDTPHIYLNKLLLSISLNTITLSYDKYLKKILSHYWLKSDDYFCDSRADTTCEPFHLILQNLQVAEGKKKFHSHSRNPSENESYLNSLPDSHHVQNTLQKQYLQRQTFLSSSSCGGSTNTNMDANLPKPDNTEVNNNIYYSIWNCDSKTEIKEIPKRQNELKGLNHDENDWISAHDDFTSAADLMDVVGECPRLFDDVDDERIKAIKNDSRTYSTVVIWYDDSNPMNNEITYEKPYNTLNDTTTKINTSLVSANANERINNPNRIENTRKRINVNALQDCVKDFLNTIKDIEDEDELILVSDDRNHIQDEEEEIMEDFTDGSCHSRKKSLEVKFTKNTPESTEPEIHFIKKEKQRHKVTRNEPLPKMRTSDHAQKYKEARQSRRRSMGEEMQLFQNPMSNMRHSKSTSNLLEALDDEQAKPSSNFMSKIKKVFTKKREVPLGPGPPENKIFGNAIGSLDMSEKVPNVPSFVVACIENLQTSDVIKTHGLYRASGNKTTIDEIKKKIDESGSKSSKRYECLKDQEPNTLAGLLKQFFRELEPGLISIEIAKQCVLNADDKKLIKRQISIIDDIHQKCTLKYLIKHLASVNEHRKDNLMDSNNISIVWGPCLFKSMHTADAIQSGLIVNINRVVKTMIDHYDEIFREIKMKNSQV